MMVIVADDDVNVFDTIVSAAAYLLDFKKFGSSQIYAVLLTNGTKKRKERSWLSDKAVSKKYQ
jgi:hypothetical protein